MNVIIEPIQEPVALTPATFEAVCQMANEALSNAIRHAHAQHVHISTAQTAHQFTLTISDDGEGFDSREMQQDDSGLGLRNMQERARLHGGSITIDSTPGKGTKFSMSIPI